MTPFEETVRDLLNSINVFPVKVDIIAPAIASAHEEEVAKLASIVKGLAKALIPLANLPCKAPECGSDPVIVKNVAFDIEVVLRARGALATVPEELR